MSGHLLVRTEFADLYIDVLNLVQCLMMISQITQDFKKRSHGVPVHCGTVSSPEISPLGVGYLQGIAALFVTRECVVQ